MQTFSTPTENRALKSCISSILRSGDALSVLLPILPIPSRSLFQTSKLLLYHRGSFHIAAPGLLNSVPDRAAQGQDAGSPPRLERGAGGRTDARSLPGSCSPGPGGELPPRPVTAMRCRETAYGCTELKAARCFPRTPLCVLRSEGNRRQMSIVQAEGEW